MSRPARGAWVEIEEVEELRAELQSRPARGAWVEISFLGASSRGVGMSRPARGAWVEILTALSLSLNSIIVAPRKGRVG